MILNISPTIVTININGQIKTYINSNKNRQYLQKQLPQDVWNNILKEWGSTPYIADEKELPIAQLEPIQNEKIQQLKEKCMNTIVKGIEHNQEHYSFEITDQLNLARLAMQAKNGKAQLIYHADGKPCRFYTTNEIIELNEAMENFIEYHTTYFNMLKNYVKTLKLRSQIASVYYGMEIPNNTLQLLLLDQEVE